MVKAISFSYLSTNDDMHMHKTNLRTPGDIFILILDSVYLQTALKNLFDIEMKFPSHSLGIILRILKSSAQAKAQANPTTPTYPPRKVFLNSSLEKGSKKRRKKIVEFST